MVGTANLSRHSAYRQIVLVSGSVALGGGVWATHFIGMPARAWAERVHAGEYLGLGKGGREVWGQASYNPIFNADGKPFKMVLFATDLSARRAMEEQLRIAKQRAEQAVESRTLFLANMSHEIRTPARLHRPAAETPLNPAPSVVT